MKKHLIIIFLIILASTSRAANTLNINQYQSLPDAVISIQLTAENNDPFVAFQADIPIPEGFKYVENSATLNVARINGHALSVSLLVGNVLRLIGYSPNNVAFSGNTGSLVSFSLKSGKIPGTFPLQINEAMLGNNQSANILTGTSNGSVTVLAPDIQVSATNLNFYRVALGTQAENGFQIQNTGNQDLIINSLSFDEPQFSTTETSANISIPGESSRYIPVRFVPTTKGNYAKSLYINSNDPDQPSLKVNLEAIAYAVNELHMGNISGASSTQKTLEFSVNNMEAFTGIQFDIQLPQALSYTSGSAKLFRQDDHVIAVNPLNNNTLRVLAFSPGNKNFKFNAGKLIELEFLLNGNGGYYSIGISNVLISDNQGNNTVSAYFGGSLQITSSDIYSSNQLAFGDVSMTSQKEMQHTIYNYGQEPLIINQLTFSDPNFSSSQTLPVIIQPYQQANLPVVFRKSSKGTGSAIMKIFSNDPDQGIYQVELTGNAYAPNHLKVKTQNIKQGESSLVEIDMENYDDIVALQFDLNYPTGISPQIDSIRLTGRKQDHLIANTLLNNNTLRILVFSSGQQAFRDKNGAVIQIPFNSNLQLGVGSHELSFSNAFVSNRNSENVLYSTQNGILNVSDINSDRKDLTSNDISIYPIVVTDEINILTSSENKSFYKIINMTGQTIKIGNFIGNCRISVSELERGIYIIDIEQGKLKLCRKFIKK